MKLSAGQVKLLHVYASYARIAKAHYRDIIERCSGCRSSLDPSWSQAAFDAAMAKLETILFDRADRGLVPDPRLRNRRIRDTHYWRRKQGGRNAINSRQRHAVENLWAQLCAVLPTDQTTPAYLAGIIAKATGKRDVGQTALTHAQAGHVIDALRDRLNYAIRQC